jgi:predicted nucleotide-binding protein
VFIVHGRASDLQTEVALYLTRLGIDPIILHEQADQGRTIIAKFEEVAEKVAFAVVLMTPDDEGGLAGMPIQKRARQNVIFEHGYFVAKLGANRVCALVKGQIEKPSDINGILYVEANESSHWKMRLARELKSAGIPADYTRVVDI